MTDTAAVLLEKINNSVLDLQNSTFQTFERPMKTLSRLLKNPILAEINAELTKDVDLDAFLEESAKSKGGMVGGAKLNWPDDQEKTLGLTLLLIEKFSVETDFLLEFGYVYLDPSRSISNSIRSVVSNIIIPFARDYKTLVLNKSKHANSQIPMASNSDKIFIVHGHDGEARETVARFIEKIGFRAVILHEQASQNRTIIEKVEAESDVGFAVVLLTPDDVGCEVGGDPKPRARQNVILELGYFMGRLGRSRVCALKRGIVDIPSDFAGVVWTDMDASKGWQATLARELDAAGYAINWNDVMR